MKRPGLPLWLSSTLLALPSLGVFLMRSVVGETTWTDSERGSHPSLRVTLFGHCTGCFASADGASPFRA
jgi:hypothetical protein